MDNQHKLIRGYRDLSQAEIDLMNEIKAKAEECGNLASKLRLLSMSAPPGETLAFQLDGRWVSIGTTHLQEGFMALVRAVAKPTIF